MSVTCAIALALPGLQQPFIRAPPHFILCCCALSRCWNKESMKEMCYKLYANCNIRRSLPLEIAAVRPRNSSAGLITATGRSVSTKSLWSSPSASSSVWSRAPPGTNRVPAPGRGGGNRWLSSSALNRDDPALLKCKERRRKTGGSRLDLPVLSYTGGTCGEYKSSPTSCSRKTVYCKSRARGGLLGKRTSGKSGRMELFKPQMMDTRPFQFLSEYHTTPPRAVKDGISPIYFFGLGQATPPVIEVVQAGDPVLHEPAAEVRMDEIGSARIEKIINDMVASMRNAPGVGLAAPQIGVPLQIIVLEDTKELISYSSVEECEAQQRFPFDLLVIINPKLKTKSGSGSAVFFEGCLSVDGYRALVERDLDVEVIGLGRDGRPIHVEASGWKARILQHECDHLAGNLYVDKMVPKTFRTRDNLRLPLPAGCPKPGLCKHSTKSLKL